MTIINKADNEDEIETVLFDFDEEAGLTAANLLGMTVQELLLDGEMVDKLMQRCMAKLEMSVSKASDADQPLQ